MSIQRQLIRGNTTSVEAVTQLPGQFGFDTTKNEPHVGNGALAGGIRLAKKNLKEALTPAQITADTNDYNPTNLKHAGVLILTTDAARNLTGLVPTTTGDTTDGRSIELYNGGSQNLTLKDQNTSSASAAANRFNLGGADITLSPGASATLRYNLTAARWQLVAQTAGSAVGAGSVLARTLANSALGFSMINGTIVCSVSAGALTIAIKNLAGNDPSSSDPVLVQVRDATLATGDYVVMSLVAATSLVISSGSSMGAASATPFSLRLIGINDAGTFRLGAINLGRGAAAVPMLNPDQLLSSTAEGGSGNADSAYVIYTGTAVSSKPFAMLGSLDWSSGLTTVGAWDAVPSAIQLFGQGDLLPGYSGTAAVAKKELGMVGGVLVESHAGNAVTYAVKALSGNDPSPNEPVTFTFQSVGAASLSALTVRQVTSALSITVPSGQALGTSNGVAFRLWLIAIDTGSSVVLGVVNCVSGGSVIALMDGVQYSSTAIATAPSAQVIYSAAAQAAKIITPIGYVDYDSGMAAAGTWNAFPSRIIAYAPGMRRPGEPTGVQAISQTGVSATGTTQIPLDNTIPQSNEGDQYLSQAITPSAAQNLLEIDAGLYLANSAGATTMTVALFRDSGANAIGVGSGNAPGAGIVGLARALMSVLAGAPSSTTFKARAGLPTAGTTTFNGAAGAQLYGGVFTSFLKIRELMG